MIDFDADEILAEDVPAPYGEPVIPENSEQATAWLAKVAQIQKLKAEYLEAYDAAVAKLKARLDERMESLETQEHWYTEALEIFHRTILANEPDRLTIHLPTGKLVSRQTPAKWEITDQTLFIEWALRNAPELVHFPDPTVKVSEIKKALKEDVISDGHVTIGDGTTVPGVAVSEGERKFDIKVD